MGLERRKGLMIAIDTKEKKEYENLKNVLPSISELDDNIIFKAGLPTVLKFGFSNVIDFLRQYDSKIIFDAKLAEESKKKALEILNTCKEHNLDGIIVHGFIPEEIIRSLVKNSENTDIIAIARMSSETLFNRYYKEIARKSVNCGSKGVVVGANHPEYIRKVRSIVDEINDSTYICSPGIGYQGGDAKTALMNGTDYLIIGRSILKADDPREKAKEYLETLKSK